MLHRVVPVALLLAALAVMARPTHQLRWATDPATGIEHLSWHPWFSPLIFGYGNPFPLLSMLCTAIALVIVLVHLRGGGGSVAAAVLLGLALAAIAAGALVFGGVQGAGWAAPIALLLCLVVEAIALLRARDRRRSEGADEADGAAGTAAQS